MKLNARRYNLGSTDVIIDHDNVLKSGSFRVVYRGTFTNGHRMHQAAACKRFIGPDDEDGDGGRNNMDIINEHYIHDPFKALHEAIEFAQLWNAMCRSKDSIQFNEGQLITYPDGIKYVVEPMISPYNKYTDNMGWIWNENSKRVAVQCLEAFSHYTYHISNRKMIVCDLQGIYGLNRSAFFRSRYILSDPAICSKKRLYGPSDMGQKGIDSFFVNHVCNNFCLQYGKGEWKRPPRAECYFISDSVSDELGYTKMMSSTDSHLLSTKNHTKFDK